LEYAPAPPSPLCFCSLPRPEELLSSNESLDPPILEEDVEGPPRAPAVAPVAPPEEEEPEAPPAAAAAAAIAAAAAAALWAAKAEEPGMVRVLWGSVEQLELVDAPPPPAAPADCPPEEVPDDEVRLEGPEWPMVRDCCCCCLAESIVTCRPWVWYARWARPRMEASRGGTTGQGSWCSDCFRKKGSDFM